MITDKVLGLRLPVMCTHLVSAVSWHYMFEIITFLLL